MIGLVGLFKAVGEAFGFARTLTDSKQRRERYELLLDKKVHVALNAAETIIHGADALVTESISLKQFKVILKKHRRKFFDND